MDVKENVNLFSEPNVLINEVIPETLNLFTKPSALLSVSEYKFEKVSTRTVLDGSSSQLDISVQPDKIYYTDLKNSFLMVKCKYVNNDGSAIAAAPTIGPVQNPLTAMFKGMEMWINDKKVTQNEANMAYINHLHLFTQSKAAKDTYLGTSLWYEDTFTSTDTANQSDPQSAANTNKGLNTRANYFGGSREVQLIGRIFIPPHTTNRLYLPNLKFDYQFIMAPMSFFSMSAEAAGTYQFVITEAAMLIKRVAVNPALSTAHSIMLQTMNKNAIYSCRYLSSRTYNIPAGSWSFKFENAFVGNEMPVAVFIMLVKSNAKAGTLTENPFVFYTANLQELICKLGTKRIPAVEYKINPAQKQTQFSLWETYMALDYFGSNNGPGNLDRSTFENGAFIVGFDLSRDGNPNAEYHNSTFEAANLSLEGSFSLATMTGYTGKENVFKYINIYILVIKHYFLVIALGLFNGQIEINKFYSPFTSWG